MPRMLHDPDRHEALRAIPWNEQRARDAIERIVAGAVQRFSPEGLWPWHPLELEPGDDPAQPPTPLRFGAAGTMWAIDYLQAMGAASTNARYDAHFETLVARNRAWLATQTDEGSAAFQVGDTPVLMMAQGRAPTPERADELARLIEHNLDHPARELMWGAPGTMLAALFLHQRFGEERWSTLFRRSAARLREQLKWSDTLACHYWDQDMYKRHYTFLDAVHGFVATAGVLVRGRHLLAADDWADWARIIATTVRKTAIREAGRANWPVQVSNIPVTRPKEQLLMQFCHGSPGFVICLADWPDGELDDLLLEGGEATWDAGPLTKGANLCHGTDGNGYAFLKLFERTGDARWLERARQFAMHALAQSEAAERTHGELRWSLWTGDLGLAVYLFDCVRGRAAFPTLDVFYAPA